MSNHTLVLLRHGQSQWNKENRFTGWVDVDLSEQGLTEARAAGQALHDARLGFDIAYTSILKRAIRTLWMVMEQMDAAWLPVVRAWQLNERHYGALQGLNKAQTAAKHGEEQVHAWRRGYAIQPPPLDAAQLNEMYSQPRYGSIPADQRPASESLADTVARVVPYWNNVISPDIRAGRRVLIAAHGNSLRALVKHLDSVSDDAIVEMNIPTGLPLVYELDADLKPLSRQYLGDPDAVEAAMAAVAAQGKAQVHG